MDIKRIVNIDFHRCAKGLLKGRLFILFLTVLGSIIGIFAALFVVKNHNEYEAVSSVYNISYGSYAESEEGLSALRAYSDIIKSYRVAERAALLLADPAVTKDMIYNMISVDSRVVRGTTYVYENISSVILIHANSESEGNAIRIVNAVADAFVMEINGISETESTRVLDYAYDGEIVYNAVETQLMVVGAGLIGGFLLGCMIILCRIIFSYKIVSANDAGLYGQIEIVGVIPKF